MTAVAPRRIAFLGFGLIGGSIARSLGTADRPTLVGWSPSGRGPAEAVRDGVLDAAVADPAAAVRDADLVVVAAPPLAAIELIAELGASLRGALPADAVVTDVTSTKVAITAAANAAGLRFVGGHPMAGRETSGYETSTGDLFRERPWVVVPGPGPDPVAVERVTWLAGACGARPVRMDAADHDTAVAAISHVPIVVAAALVEAMAGSDVAAPGWEAAAALAASGWRDTTRVARGDPEMGAGIIATNREPVAAGLARLRTVLDGWLIELSGDGEPDATRIEARLGRARELLESRE